MNHHSARLLVPSVLSVTLVGCPPTMNAPGSCVRDYSVPDGATAPSASARPMIDLAPCPTSYGSGDFSCTTAAGCVVRYSDGNPNPGDPARYVTCPATDRCLFGIGADGALQYGRCPSLEVLPQTCENVLYLADARRSGFACAAQQDGCAVEGGGIGQRVAFVRRTVDGAVSASDCPTRCTPFS